MNKLGRQLKRLLSTALIVLLIGVIGCTFSSSEEGEPVRPADLDQELRQLLDQATAGDVEAQFRLGVAWRNGTGVEPDFVQAAAWFEKASQAGHAEAQGSLGVLYWRGLGVEQDHHKAVEYAEMGARQGNRDARLLLVVLLLDRSAVRDPGRGFALAKELAEEGITVAESVTAQCYYDGDGVEQNHTEAVRWFGRASENGDSYAQYWLGRCYLEGTGVEINLELAKKWLSISAAAGNPDAASLMRRLSEQHP